MSTIDIKPNRFATLTALLSGAVFAAISVQSLRAGIDHYQLGEARWAAITLTCMVAFTAVTLALWMPGPRNGLLRQSAYPMRRALIRLAGILLLGPILIVFSAFAKYPGAFANPVVPAQYLAPTTFLITLGFLVSFVLPGVAYWPYKQVRPRAVAPAAPRLSAPRPPMIQNRALWIGASILGLIYLAGMLASVLALMFVSAIPSADLLSASRTYLPISALVASLPLMALIIWARAREGTEGKLQSIGKTFIFLAVMLVMGGFMVVQITEQIFPFAWNAAHAVPYRTHSYTVVDGTAFGTRGCGDSVKIRVVDPDGWTTSVCHLPHDLVVRAKPGDQLLLGGKEGPYGMTYSRADLLPHSP